MSRMIGFSSPWPLPPTRAIGPDLLERFAALARLHADGWGMAALVDHRVSVFGEGAAGTVERLGRRLGDAALAGTLYLRFASRGAPPAPENTQPFLRDGIAFQHNGLLSPRSDAVALLDPRARAQLRGTTDSEAYFGVVLSELEGAAGRGARVADAAARAALRLRGTFAEACLNAFLVAGDGLVVVHSAGSVAVPLGAFAERGLSAAELPPGHDESYNVLRTTVTDLGVALVATTGVDSPGWLDLPADSVTLFSDGRARSIPL